MQAPTKYELVINLNQTDSDIYASRDNGRYGEFTNLIPRAFRYPLRLPRMWYVLICV